MNRNRTFTVFFFENFFEGFDVLTFTFSNNLMSKATPMYMWYMWYIFAYL